MTKLFKMPGTGLPNVFLVGGVRREGSGEDETFAYEKLNELYFEIARAVATRVTPLTGAELRFLRKRLGMTQSQVGALGGKSVQAAAKWEKDVSQMPAAESHLVRMAWLVRFSRRDLPLAVQAMTDPDGSIDSIGDYVFIYRNGVWSEAPAVAKSLARNAAMPIAIQAVTKARHDATQTLLTTQTQHGNLPALTREELT